MASIDKSVSSKVITIVNTCTIDNKVMNSTDAGVVKPQTITTVDVGVTKNQAITTVNIHVAKNLLDEGHRYLDVRTEEEFKNGHLENSLNVPYMFNTSTGRVKNVKFLEGVLGLCGKDDHLIVGCQSGVRSVYATTDLLEAGFKHVSNMGGGYIEWIGNGFFVTK